MDQILILLLISGFISYSAWIFSTINTNKSVTQIASGAMFIIVLLLLWRVFQLNLDFGLVLSIATLVAGISWIVGLILKLKNLISESKSYFWIFTRNSVH